ncbi:LamG-like jellyroll fold domain-containing protein [Flagellimonas pacifica]|uniref:Exonuclease III n=1 Tax=Flagellimonas pacifica TaxID=1247520 RepID=A0A285MUY3_9FLAO|nr:LamG-like jellyroll fold domain-containing protein [Allomuricauda parva]SNZ00992.1 Exonuclease III [Allomuricauda parva]
MNLPKILVSVITFVWGLGILKAQNPIFHLDFDTHGFNETIIQKEDAVYMVDLLQSQYAKGLTGRALDLSANAALRRPVKLKKEEIISFTEETSFSIQIWVKTLPNALMGTPILGNKKANDLTTKGWQVYTRENGAWALILNDGKGEHHYRPTAQRQRVNDGEWHQVVFTVNREKQEIWMYFDGKNTAIYNTPGIGDFNTDLATVIGGSDEKWEYGSNGQWNAFNGFLDEVKIWDRTITPGEVHKEYTLFYPTTFGNDESFEPQHLKVLSWNIWHGGHRYGEVVGLQRVIETIKSTNADIIGLVETYGSGEIIADSLGYYFYLISSNLSIMSRYPISETITAFKPFNFGGAKLKIGKEKELIFFDAWLHYLPDYGKGIIEENKTPKELIIDEGETRYAEIKEIIKEIKPYLKNTTNIPVIMAGDFNGGSHLDWNEETKAIHYNTVVEWPVSKLMVKSGFIDSYRELHLNPLLDPGFTWTPRAATSSTKYGLRDRIDYVYYQGKTLSAIESKVIDYHPIMFPSDHAGVITVFRVE